jgi:cob(I)alamin adenosyltransferase
MKIGLVQIYTGNGKGKSTASFGLVLRACGHGLKAFVAQFAKGLESGELNALKRFDDLVTFKQFGRGGFIHEKPQAEDIRLAREGWQQAQDALNSGHYDLVVLDEIGIALHYEMIEVEEVKTMIAGKPSTVELVLTGRKVPESLFVQADLVTEMREIKHYFNRGIEARQGIEY